MLGKKELCMKVNHQSIQDTLIIYDISIIVYAPVEAAFRD